MYLKFLKFLGIYTTADITHKRIDKLKAHIQKEVNEITKETGATIIIQNNPIRITHFIEYSVAQANGF